MELSGLAHGLEYRVHSHRIPAAQPSCTSAVDTPPEAPCPSRVWPDRGPGRHEQHSVGGCLCRPPRGSQRRRLGTTVRRRTTTVSVKLPCGFSVSGMRPGSRVSSPTAPSSAACSAVVMRGCAADPDRIVIVDT